MDLTTIHEHDVTVKKARQALLRCLKPKTREEMALLMIELGCTDDSIGPKTEDHPSFPVWM